MLAIVLALGLGMCLASGSGSGHGSGTTVGPAQSASEWTCPMHPQIRKNQPGTCPICGMDLVEVETEEPTNTDQQQGADAHQDVRISLSDESRILARIRTHEVEPMSTAARALRLLGRVDYDETRVKSVTAWTGGRIDRLLVATTGRTITPGQTIAKLYSPEIYAAQSDLLQAVRQVERLGQGDEYARRAAEAALEAARQRLRLLGVGKKQLDTMEAADAPERHVWIHSPFGGTVIERKVNEGDYVSPGSALYRVADLSRVWVQLDAYETDTPLLRVGDRVTLTVVGLPGKVFTGDVAFIDPVVEKGTRIVKVRVEVDNPDRVLKPGMFAEAVLESERASAATLMVPSTAPLFTGQRSLVYVEIPNTERPTYEAREVVLGPRAGDWYPVISGLEVGERVVVRGAFVIDADLQIKGRQSMMTRDDDSTRDADEPVADIPARVRARSADVLAAYLDMRAALARDDLESARAAGLAMSDKVVLIGAEMPDSLRPRWQPLARSLADHARYLHGRPDLASARQAFRRLSEQVMSWLEVFGNPLERSVRLFYCKQDFDGLGAHWLQPDQDVGNPYRASDADRCILLRTQVAPGEHLDKLPDPASKPEDDGDRMGASGGHQH